MVRRKAICMLHNVIGHPMMFWCYLFGFKKAGDWWHDATLPRDPIGF